MVGKAIFIPDDNRMPNRSAFDENGKFSTTETSFLFFSCCFLFWFHFAQIYFSSGQVSEPRTSAPRPPRRRVTYASDKGGLGYFSDTDVPVTWSRPKNVVRNFETPFINFQDIFDMRQYQSDLDYNALFDLTRSPYLLRRKSPNRELFLSTD